MGTSMFSFVLLFKIDEFKSTCGQTFSVLIFLTQEVLCVCACSSACDHILLLFLLLYSSMFKVQEQFKYFWSSHGHYAGYQGNLDTLCWTLLSVCFDIHMYLCSSLSLTLFNLPVNRFLLFLQHAPTVERALQRSVKLELLDGENLYMCPRFDMKWFLLSVNLMSLITCSRTWMSNLFTQRTCSWRGC